jgi:peptide/nickel transport system permease protein
MLKFTLRRLATGVLLLFAVCALAYLMLYVGSASIAAGILGMNATKQDIARFNHDHGLDKNFFESFISWASHAITGDFGAAWTFPDPVSETIGMRLGVTLTLVVVSLTIVAIVSLCLGVLGAVKGGWADRLVQVLGLAGFALPNFLVAFGLVIVFAVINPWFNAVGWVPPEKDFGEFIKSATLPIAAISFVGLASLTQQIRGAVKDTLQGDFVRTLRTSGLSYNRVVFKHVLRNAAGPALSVLGLQFIGMLGGIVIIEQIFAIPGLGSLSVSATSARDIPTVMGVVATMALIVIVVNFVIDILSAALNPKVRLS